MLPLIPILSPINPLRTISNEFFKTNLNLRKRLMMKA